MKLTRTKITLTIALTSVGAAVLWAFNPQPDPPGFGMIGVTDTQVARLNVVCHNPPIDMSGTPQGCTVNVGFGSASGRLLKSAILTVPARIGAFLEITPAELRGVIDPSSRRAAIVPFAIPEIGSRIVPALELYDLNFGKTEAFMNVAAPRLSFFSTGQ